MNYLSKTRRNFPQSLLFLSIYLWLEVSVEGEATTGYFPVNKLLTLPPYELVLSTKLELEVEVGHRSV